MPRRDWTGWGILAVKDTEGPIDPMARDEYDECQGETVGEDD